jgi:peptidoglycan/xylan/chitin deacetylase (PgdA/CDA1 family)
MLRRQDHLRAHGLGNHTATHPNLTDLSSDQVACELDEVQDVVRQILGQPEMNLTLMRAPYGRPFNPIYRSDQNAADFCRVAQAVAPRAVHVYWDLDPRDWEVDNAAEVIARVRNLLMPSADGIPGGRGVILLHSDRPQTAAALPAILALLKEQQIRVVDLETYVELVYGASSGQLIER